MGEEVNREEWTLLETVEGSAQAEILRGLLEAQGIPVMLSQEGVARFAYSVSVGPLSEVDVLVPSGRWQEGRQVIDEYWLGSFAAKDRFDRLDQEDPDTGETPAAT